MISNVPANDDAIKPKVIFDLDIGYELHSGAKISVGADNLFNVYPTVLKPANQGNTGFAYYNSYSPYGISGGFRSEEHTSELQSLMRISYAVFCLKKKNTKQIKMQTS